jgi:hypothetical protein
VCLPSPVISVAIKPYSFNKGKSADGPLGAILTRNCKCEDVKKWTHPQGASQEEMIPFPAGGCGGGS